MVLGAVNIEYPTPNICTGGASAFGGEHRSTEFRMMKLVGHKHKCLPG
jgi:hypothetical protein